MQYDSYFNKKKAKFTNSSQSFDEIGNTNTQQIYRFIQKWAIIFKKYKKLQDMRNLKFY